MSSGVLGTVVLGHEVCTDHPIVNPSPVYQCNGPQLPENTYNTTTHLAHLRVDLRSPPEGPISTTTGPQEDFAIANFTYLTYWRQPNKPWSHRTYIGGARALDTKTCHSAPPVGAKPRIESPISRTTGPQEKFAIANFTYSPCSSQPNRSQGRRSYIGGVSPKDTPNLPLRTSGRREAAYQRSYLLKSGLPQVGCHRKLFPFDPVEPAKASRPPTANN